MQQPAERSGERTVRQQIEDIVKQTEEQGLQTIAKLLCFNVSNQAQTNPLGLTDDQGRKYVFRMKKLLSAHYLQMRSRT